MSTLGNKQTITIEWNEGNTREVDVMLNTWFMGVYVQNVLAVAGSIEDAIERANKYQREYGVEGRVTHKVRPKVITSQVIEEN